MKPCFECGKPAEHEHHIMPKLKGGIRTVPLCTECHGKIHDCPMTKPELQRAGIQARRQANGGKCPWGGRKTGTRIKVTEEVEALIRQLHQEKKSIAAIARLVKVSRPTVYAVLGK